MQTDKVSILKAVSAILDEPLDASSPEVLTEQISKAEAYSHVLVELLAISEHAIEQAQATLSKDKSSIIDKYKSEKNDVMNIKVEGDLAEQIKDMNNLRVEANKIKSIIKLIDRRCSIGQSMLSNITASIKAGINL